jgi:hypothetical protein
LQPEARAINDAFARFIRAGRPLVTLKAALSADGMLAPPASARTARQPHWLTGPESRAEVQRMRHAADAVLTGIGTVLADDPRSPTAAACLVAARCSAWSWTRACARRSTRSLCARRTTMC